MSAFPSLQLYHPRNESKYAPHYVGITLLSESAYTAHRAETRIITLWEIERVRAAAVAVSPSLLLLLRSNKLPEELANPPLKPIRMTCRVLCFMQSASNYLYPLRNTFTTRSWSRRQRAARAFRCFPRGLLLLAGINFTIILARKQPARTFPRA